MHKTLLKAKEILETSLCDIVENTCPDEATKTDVCLINEIVNGIHQINKIIVDDSMRIQFYDEYKCMKNVKDVDELINMYDEFMAKREKEGHSYDRQDRR